MCGIIGYTGDSPAKEILINGLKQLEYRGYDSAGIALVDPKTGIVLKKRTGKVEELEKASQEIPDLATTGIGHTRWATHGGVNETNCHPHRVGSVTIIHNGIIENYKELIAEHGLKDTLASETDTEVVAALLDK